MIKTFTAVFDGETLHPEVPLDLKPNVRYLLTVEQEVEEIQEQSAWDVLERLAGTVEGPEDWATEHDYYLYGTPKWSEGPSS